MLQIPWQLRPTSAVDEHRLPVSQVDLRVGSATTTPATFSSPRDAPPVLDPNG
jgi:hypothetical protein